MIRCAKLPTAGAGLKSYLSSGKSSAMAFSLRPISFHCSSTACDALGAGFGAFGAGCAPADVINIPTHNDTPSKTVLFIDSPPYQRENSTSTAGLTAKQ